MGNLNPLGRGLPAHLQEQIEMILPKIKEDHWVSDSHRIEGHLICACGIVVEYLGFTKHLSDEVSRIIDLEQSI